MSWINTVDYYYELITEVSNFSEGKTILISTVLHSISDRNLLVIRIFIFVMNLLYNEDVFSLKKMEFQINHKENIRNSIYCNILRCDLPLFPNIFLIITLFPKYYL